MRLLRCGEDGLLVEPDDPAAVLPLALALRGLDGVRETVPAARVLLVRGAFGIDRLRERIAAVDVTAAAPPPGAAVTLDVHYDGEDLGAVAADVGLDPDGVVRAHCGGDYVVAFCGFAPGFAYLTGLDPVLHVGRLAQPRTRVPAGSVGVAGEFTGVYPRESPGGWRLLGRTSADLWDADRDPPALLDPGTRVRFRPVP